MDDNDRYIWFEVDEDAVMRGLKLQEEMLHRHLKNFLDDLARKGEEVLEAHAPKYPGDPEHIGGYTKKHVDHSPARFDGIDEYQAIVGVKEGKSQHPVYANSGTGLYGKHGEHVQSYRGRLMYFYATRLGRVISMHMVEGQPPQQYLYYAWRDLALYAEARLLSGSFRPGI